MNTIIPLLIVILTVCIIDYYIENVAISHLQGARVAFYSSVAMFVGAIFFSYTWNHPYVTKATTLHKIKDIVTEDHVLSGGVIFSVLIFILGKKTLALLYLQQMRKNVLGVVCLFCIKKI